MIRLDKKDSSTKKPNSFRSFQNQLSSLYRSNIDFQIVESLKESAKIEDNRSSYY